MPWLQGSPEGLQVDVRTTGNLRHPLTWAKPCLIPRRIQLPYALRGPQLSWNTAFKSMRVHTGHSQDRHTLCGPWLSLRGARRAICHLPKWHCQAEKPSLGGMGVGSSWKKTAQTRLYIRFHYSSHFREDARSQIGGHTAVKQYSSQSTVACKYLLQLYKVGHARIWPVLRI